jgi:hypothetical protein
MTKALCCHSFQVNPAPLLLILALMIEFGRGAKFFHQLMNL